MHINPEYAVYMQAESEGHDFVIANKKFKHCFAYLRIVLYIFSLEKSAMIMSDTGTTSVNFSDLLQSWD